MIITITGPRSIGKSTISKLVAKKLSLPYISSDEIGEKYFEKQGGLDKAIKSGVIDKFIKEEAYSLIKAQYKKDNFVIDLSGGSISSRKHPEVSEELRKLIKSKSIVIGLLPSENPQESIDLLFSREQHRVHFKSIPKEELFKKVEDDYHKFPSLFKSFAHHIVYTLNKSPDKIADEIIQYLKQC